MPIRIHCGFSLCSHPIGLQSPHHSRVYFWILLKFMIPGNWKRLGKWLRSGNHHSRPNYIIRVETGAIQEQESMWPGCVKMWWSLVESRFLHLINECWKCYDIQNTWQTTEVISLSKGWEKELLKLSRDQPTKFSF